MKELRSCYIGVKEEEVLFTAENTEELYKKANGDFNNIKVLWMTKDGTAQEVDVEEEFALYDIGKPESTIKCPCCSKEVTDIQGKAAMCNDCGIIIYLDVLCPDCGAYTYASNDPGDDYAMGTYCAYSHKTITDQFMSRADYIEFYNDEYLDCEAQHRDHVDKSKRFLKGNAAFNIEFNNLEQAYKDVLTMQQREYECAESECDGCPIVETLKAKNIIGTDITHNQYATCSDFVEYMSERSER